MLRCKTACFARCALAGRTDSNHAVAKISHRFQQVFPRGALVSPTSRLRSIASTRRAIHAANPRGEPTKRAAAATTCPMLQHQIRGQGRRSDEPSPWNDRNSVSRFLRFPRYGYLGSHLRAWRDGKTGRPIDSIVRGGEIASVHCGISLPAQRRLA